MIQTIVFVKYFTGLNLVIEPKDIIRPNGIKKTSVKTNISQFAKKPSNKSKVT